MGIGWWLIWGASCGVTIGLAYARLAPVPRWLFRARGAPPIFRRRKV